MPGRLSVTTQACLLVGLISLFCWPAHAQQNAASAIPAFDIQLSVSPEAARWLNSHSEKLGIAVRYVGSPKPGVRANTYVPYVVSPRPGVRATAELGLELDGGQQLEVAGGSQTVHVPKPDPSQIAKIAGPFYVQISAGPLQGNRQDVSCDGFYGRAEDAAAGPVQLRCAMKSEAKRDGIGMGLTERSAADSYAIYSLLLPGGSLDMISPTKARSWAVADTTVNITDMNPAVPPGAQLKDPPDNKEAFEQALRDFKIRQYERFHLTASGFSGSKPDLIDQQRVQEIRDSGQGGIVFFSAVYFNDNNTAALVFVNTWCAHLCSAGQWVYLEKQGGQWVRRSGLTVPGA